MTPRLGHASPEIPPPFSPNLRHTSWITADEVPAPVSRDAGFLRGKRVRRPLLMSRLATLSSNFSLTLWIHSGKSTSTSSCHNNAAPLRILYLENMNNKEIAV